MITIIDITSEYCKKNNTCKGSIIFESGYDYDSHQDEIETAKWLVSNFGGDIILLKESNKQREEKPDYLWKNKFWERKGINSSKHNTIDSRIRKAYSQIYDKRGGILLDFSQSVLKLEQAVKEVKNSVEKRAKGNADIIIKKNNSFIVLKVTK